MTQILAANFEFAGFQKQKKYIAYYRFHYHFHGNGPYSKLLTKKEPITLLEFTSKLPCYIIITVT